MSRPAPPSYFKSLWLRGFWWWRKKTGWRIEGRRPRPGEKTCFLLDKGFDSSPAMASFLSIWLPEQTDYPNMAEPEVIPIMMSAGDRGNIDNAVKAAWKARANIQLVRFDAVAKRVRLHTPLKPGAFPDRTTKYIERIFSQSPQNQKLNTDLESR